MSKCELSGSQSEVYITPSWDINPLTSINGKATVVSKQAFESRYPSGKIPRSSKDHGKLFICRRGCNTRTATYTNEFIWEEVYQGAEDLLALTKRVESQTRATRKRKRGDALRDDAADDVYQVSLPAAIGMLKSDSGPPKATMRSQRPPARSVNIHEAQPPSQKLRVLPRSSLPRAINGLCSKSL